MPYRYEFDDKSAGNLRLTRSNYEILQEGLRQLYDELDAWNRRALEHGAACRPYEVEVKDLSRMIKWGNAKLDQTEAEEIVVDRISIGSLRYAKAALILAIRKREQDRADKARQGWPEAALRSLDDGIQPIKKIAKITKYEPSDVLWEVIPKESRKEGTWMAEWDVFISHASEDKEDFARPLAEGLRARGLKVWFDEITLTVGDSLRRSIDRGLAHSRFGIVVISPNFMRKEWTQKELDGLVGREVAGTKVILPVWHGVTTDEIRAYSPILADRFAVSSDKGLEHVISELMRAIRRSEEPKGTDTRNATSPSPTSDVRVILRGPARQARFIIENLGPGVVRDVHFEVDAQEGKESPLVANDCKEKLPVQILRPGARMELIAALTFGTGTTFRARWWWHEEDGRVEERNERIAMQVG